MTAQPLPDRPGAMAAQPVRGSVTAGRPLPPRPGAVAQAVQAPPKEVAPAQQPIVPASARVARRIEAKRPSRPSRPDPRPMRVALGAGAVAAMSVFAVGLVKPNVTATAEQPAAESDVANAAANDGPSAQARSRVRRVTEYVFLQPGEKAPRGATVISADELLGRPSRTSPSNPAPAGQPAPTRQPAAAGRPAPQATRQPAPRPTPKPVRTRQSG